MGPECRLLVERLHYVLAFMPDLLTFRPDLEIKVRESKYKQTKGVFKPGVDTQTKGAHKQVQKDEF